jgi:predicted nucleic acid-binding protein
MTLVYDAGMLVAADRSDRRAWADHRIRLELGIVAVTTAPVVAQVSRSPRQAQLRRFLRGCDTVALTPDDAHEVGALLCRAGTSDVVDAHLVVTAARTSSAVLTSDPHDLRRLAELVSPPVEVISR